MICVKLQKDDKTIRFYNRGNFVVLLCSFLPNNMWWDQINKTWNKVTGHSYKEVDMGIIFIENAKISEVYEIVKNQSWWQDGKTLD